MTYDPTKCPLCHGTGTLHVLVGGGISTPREVGDQHTVPSSCNACDGTGQRPLGPPRMLCPRCKGQGQRLYASVHRGDGSVEEDYIGCDLCEGEGHAVCGAVFNAIGDTTELVIKFPTTNAALAFKAYMSDGGGEQPFLEHQDIALEDGDITEREVIREFVYHTGDNTIIAKG